MFLRSAEVASIVQRSLSPRSPPKHRRCLKYEHELGEHQIKPSSRSQTAESRLRATPEVYHPAVKPPKAQIHQETDGQPQGTQTSLDNSLAEELEIKKKDEAVQTVPPGSYRPLDSRSVQFLRDITNEALQRRAFTSSALNRIFLDHQFRNTYSLTQELMEKELEELRRQLGMLPKHRNSSTVSDAEALDALDALVLDPRIKEQVIHSLRLSRSSDVKKPTYTYFDRLEGEEEAAEHQLPTKDEPTKNLQGIAYANPEEHLPSAPLVGGTLSEGLSTEKGEGDTIDTGGMVAGGWDATIEEEEEEVSSASSSRDDESQDGNRDEASGNGSSEDEEVETASDEEEVTQRESTSSTQKGDTGTASQDYVTVSSKPEQAGRSTSGEESSKPDEEKNLSILQPLKLESLSSRGDKWRSSLEVVKEESDSTTGQVSDISTNSTPTEASKTNKDKESTNSVSSRTKEDTGSTGGEIIMHMDDLVDDQVEERKIKENGKNNRGLVEPQEDEKPVGSPQTLDVDEAADSGSDEGSEVESIHSESGEEEEEEEEKDTDSEMSSVHSE